MQSGSLKANLAKINKFLNTPMSFKRSYFCLLKGLTGLKVSVKETKMKSFEFAIHTSDEIVYKEPIIKELNPIYVLVKEKIIAYSAAVNELNSGFKFELPNIRHMTPIENKIKWTNADLKSISIVRNYPLPINSNIQNLSIQDLLLTKPAILNFAADDIKLAEKVRVIEEILTLSPYVKQVARKNLFKAPVIKRPLYKSYFSLNDTDNFRETLAKQNKTKKINVRITHIYDKFHVEMFSSIKQDVNSKNLICYLNENAKVVNKEKLYFLIIGERKDNKVPIKTLARLDNQ